MFLAMALFATLTSSPAPSTADTPLPDSSTIHHLIKENSNSTEALQNNYVCTAISKVHLVDSKGVETQPGNEFQSDAIPHNGGILWRKTKINGKQLDIQAQENEDKLIHEQLQSSENPGNKFFGYPPLIKYFEACETHPKRRVTISGRSIIIVDFLPPKQASTNDYMGTFASSMKGCLHIDEINGQLVKIEATVVRDIQIKSAKKLTIIAGTTFITELQLVDNKVWLPLKSVLRTPTGNTINKRYLENISHFVDYRHFEIGTVDAKPIPK